MNLCNNNAINNIIHNKQNHFYWTMIQKMDNSIELSENLKNINNYSNDFFKIIESKEQWTYADPFLYYYNDELYLFFEALNMNRLNKRNVKGIGEIYYCKIECINNEYLYSTPCVALQKPWHLSFPFIIEYNNSIYMIPEQSSQNLDIYKCIEFPNKWEFEKTLIKGSFVDSVVFFYNDYYWLFTVQKKRHNRIERLYYSKDLLGEWELHAKVNKISNNKTAQRGAGNIFIMNNKIFRPVQNNVNYYGQSTMFYQITKLNTKEYKCVEYDTLKRNIHHFNYLNGFFVIDSNNTTNDFFI
tara:strand:- start:994 stop:1890 length:897 start_codon:yes stop_codon:yes gene_type:complete